MLAAVAAAGLLGLAAPASAAAADEPLGESAGFSYFRDTRAGTGFLDVTVECPSNRRLLGMGATQRIVKLQPRDDGDPGDVPDDRATVRANLGGGTGAAEVYAVCSRDRTEYRRRTKPLDPGTTRTVKAPCPAGTKVTGGGGALTAAFDVEANADINSSFPYDGSDGGSEPDDGWAVRARSDQFDQVPKLTAQAICSDLIPTYVAVSSATPPSSFATSSASCPATHQLASTGIRLEDTPTSSEFHEIRPLDSTGGGGDADVVPDDIAQATVYNNDPAPAPATTYAVCLA